MRVLRWKINDDSSKRWPTDCAAKAWPYDVSYDGADALAHEAVHRYDVVALDRELPAVHGDQVGRALVAQRARRGCWC
jgi:DNA-binding response OmpR family regulator